MRVVLTHLTGAYRGERQVLDEVYVTIGRAHDNHVRLGRDDTLASSRHAILLVDAEGWVIQDLGSTNGTYVDGRRVDRARLRGGETIAFGYGGPQLFFEIVEEVSDERPALDESHEFPFRAGFSWSVFTAAALLAVAAVASFALTDLPLVGIPAGLAAAVLFLVGLAVVRINITVGPDGIEKEGFLQTRRVPWPSIAALEIRGGRGFLQPGPRYTVRTADLALDFSPNDFEDGHVLARVIAETSGLEWGPPAP